MVDMPGLDRWLERGMADDEPEDEELDDDVEESPDLHEAEGREAGWGEGSAAIVESLPDCRWINEEHRPDLHSAGGWTHASFFSGVGGMDIGLERAGWRTVSFSEIDPYASTVLAERWPGVVNLGDIVQLNSRDKISRSERDGVSDSQGRVEHRNPVYASGSDSSWQRAFLWTGGFPCQDLSIAGKRAGFEGERSVLAFTFLDLVERYRPPAFLLENVVGLLSSNTGRDFGRLLGEVGSLGYWWAYRVFDAQWFGVPQRRRRVFILALDARRYPDPNGPGSILAVGTRCGRNHQEERAAWSDASRRTWRGAAERQPRRSSDGKPGPDVVGTVPSALGHHGYTLGQEIYQGHLVARMEGSSLDPAGMRASDGVAGRMDNLGGVEDAIAFAQGQRGELRLTGEIATAATGGGGKPGQGYLAAFVKSRRAQSQEDDETWVDGVVMPILNGFDVGDSRATGLVSGTLTRGSSGSGGPRVDAETAADHKLGLSSGSSDDDTLHPNGLDTHRYKVIGNGVASPVAEWIGRRIMAWARSMEDE